MGVLSPSPERGNDGGAAEKKEVMGSVIAESWGGKHRQRLKGYFKDGILKAACYLLKILQPPKKGRVVTIGGGVGRKPPRDVYDGVKIFHESAGKGCLALMQPWGR